MALVELSPARADVITFTDGANDQITVSKTGTSRVILAYNPVLACGASTESVFNFCSVTIGTVLPLGTVPTSSPLTLSIVEPTGNVLSDTLQLAPNIVALTYDLIFRSDNEGVSLGTPGTPSIVETGQVQTAFTVNWSDGTSDTVQFQSDLETAVPEPASIAFLGSGLLLLSGLRYRARRARTV